MMLITEYLGFGKDVASEMFILFQNQSGSPLPTLIF